MEIHRLKIWPGQFQALRAGIKTHEVRVNDRNFREGDILLLREWEKHTQKFTGYEMAVTVTWITEGGTFGLPPSVCCMSIRVTGYWEPDA